MTVFGRQAYAVGGNLVAASHSGVKTDRIKIIAFVASGLAASLAGTMLAARSTAGNPSLGAGLELGLLVMGLSTSSRRSSRRRSSFSRSR